MTTTAENLYYLPPKDRYFNEVKREVIKIWESYDNTYGYVTEKVDRIKDIKNVRDNFMYMIAMFDHDNQKKLASQLSPEASQEVRIRMIAGGAHPGYIYF